MSELLCHLFGDYVFQNHWMANTKTSSSAAALLHASIYALPFLLLTLNWKVLLVIWATHFIIDRFRLARYWVDFYGVGKSGRVLAFVMRARGYVLGEVEVKPGCEVGGRQGAPPPVETRWVLATVFRKTAGDLVKPAERNRRLLASSLPYVADAPSWLGVWLLILVDNTFHLCINHLALAYL